MLEFNEAYEEIRMAVSAEKLFGVTDIILPTDDMLKHLKVEYEKFHEAVDPDNLDDPADTELAEDAIFLLDEFYATAQDRIKRGVWGLGETNKKLKKNHPSFSTGIGTYYLGDVFAQGEISDIYNGFCEDGYGQAGDVVIKIVDSCEDNDLIQNEIRILELLHKKRAAQWKHLPFMLDNFKTSDGRSGIILRKFHGYTLEEVIKKYKNGVDPKHMVWMLNRALSAIGYAHSRGIVHCNIDPSHLMIKLKDHNMYILDWGCAVFRPTQTGDSFKIFNDDYSPMEIKEKRPPLPSADIYSIGKIMIEVLGGNIKTNEMPDCVDPRLQAFLKAMVLRSPIQRPQNAWELWGQLDSLVKSLWGRKKFLHFSMD